MSLFMQDFIYIDNKRGFFGFMKLGVSSQAKTDKGNICSQYYRKKEEKRQCRHPYLTLTRTIAVAVRQFKTFYWVEKKFNDDQTIEE